MNAAHRRTTVASLEREAAASSDGAYVASDRHGERRGVRGVSAGNASESNCVDIFADGTPRAPIEASEVLRWERTARDLVRNGWHRKIQKSSREFLPSMRWASRRPLLVDAAKCTTACWTHPYRALGLGQTSAGQEARSSSFRARLSSLPEVSTAMPYRSHR